MRPADIGATVDLCVSGIMFYHKSGYSIDKFKPNSVYIQCNINNKDEVKTFKKKLKWAMAKKQHSLNECLDEAGSVFYFDMTYTDLKKERQDTNWKRIKDYRDRVDLFLKEYSNIIRSKEVFDNKYFLSNRHKKIKIYVDNNTTQEVVNQMYEFADKVDIDMELYDMRW